MSFDDDAREPGPHDHVGATPAKSAVLEALASMNLADENLRRFPDEPDFQIDWVLARRRWDAAVREAMR